MRAFIDTCVVIDALQSREPFAKDAQACTGIRMTIRLPAIY